MSLNYLIRLLSKYMPLVFPSPLKKKTSMRFVDPIVWTEPMLCAVGAEQNIHKDTKEKTHTHGKLRDTLWFGLKDISRQ